MRIANESGLRSTRNNLRCLMKCCRLPSTIARLTYVILQYRLTSCFHPKTHLLIIPACVLHRIQCLLAFFYSSPLFEQEPRLSPPNSRLFFLRAGLLTPSTKPALSFVPSKPAVLPYLQLPPEKQPHGYSASVSFPGSPSQSDSRSYRDLSPHPAMCLLKLEELICSRLAPCSYDNSACGFLGMLRGCDGTRPSPHRHGNNTPYV